MKTTEQKGCEHKNWIPAGYPARDNELRVCSSIYAAYCIDCGNYISRLTKEILNDKGLAIRRDCL